MTGFNCKVVIACGKLSLLKLKCQNTCHHSVDLIVIAELDSN